MFRIGIIGSGPAAYYTAQKLLKSCPKIAIDMFEKLPVPFGLVRFGVAPDHPEVKNVINNFMQVSQNTNFRYFGNVNVGVDITIKELRQLYSGIVLAYGSSSDKKLNIPGENLRQVYGAIDFVGWYNGLPDKMQLNPDLSGEEAVIIGHGNVSLDIARILLTPVDLLKNTDIPDSVLSQLASSRIKRIHLVGRRGPLQAAFTIKEFRELLKLPNVSGYVAIPKEVNISPQFMNSLSRPRKRLTSLIIDAANDKALKQDQPKGWCMHFLRYPQTVFTEDNENVKGIVFGVNELQDDGSGVVFNSDQSETIACQLVIRSIGYRNVRIDKDIPFDSALNVVSNRNGKVIGLDNTEGFAPLYCVGWIKRGPVGVIVDTISDAQETSTTILADLDRLKYTYDSVDIDRILLRRGIKYLTYSQWEIIDKFERNGGINKGKPREKLTAIGEMLAIATKMTSDK